MHALLTRAVAPLCYSILPCRGTFPVPTSNACIVFGLTSILKHNFISRESPRSCYQVQPSINLLTTSDDTRLTTPVPTVLAVVSISPDALYPHPCHFNVVVQRTSRAHVFPSAGSSPIITAVVQERAHFHFAMYRQPTVTPVMTIASDLIPL